MTIVIAETAGRLGLFLDVGSFDVTVIRACPVIGWSLDVDDKDRPIVRPLVFGRVAANGTAYPDALLNPDGTVDHNGVRWPSLAAFEQGVRAYDEQRLLPGDRKEPT